MFIKVIDLINELKKLGRNTYIDYPSDTITHIQFRGLKKRTVKWQEIVELYNRGEGLSDISRRVNMSRQAVYQVLQKAKEEGQVKSTKNASAAEGE